MHVHLHGGRCRVCRGLLRMIEADKAGIVTECTGCGAMWLVEIDALCEDCRRVYTGFLAGQLEKEGVQSPPAS
jgi:hypothetical protein